MAAKTVDLTALPDRLIFEKSSDEDIAFATSFWHSLHLLPPMESRLVSSDIKQRLRKATKATPSSAQSTPGHEFKAQEFKEFLIRAKTLDHIEQFHHLQNLAKFRKADQDLLMKHRQERIKKEEISQKVRPNRASSPAKESQCYHPESEEFLPEPEDPKSLLKEIDDFDNRKMKQTSNK